MIYAFYSFDRKVGRSMALCNVADLFYQRGLRVLVVDWDLESPGVEKFFPVDKGRLEECGGLMGMLQDYKAKMSTPISQDEGDDFKLPLDDIESYLVEVFEGSAGGGRMYVLPAGRRGGGLRLEFASNVRSFDWRDFYQNWEGDLFFEVLKQRFEELADVVLIDTNAGASDAIEICTSHFADAVVMLCGVSSQGLEGTTYMASEFCRTGPEHRRQRPCNILIIPARIDYSEAEMLNDFKESFLRAVEPLAPPGFEAGGKFFWKLKIPNIPYYEHHEALVVRQAELAIAEDLAGAYEKLAGAMGRLTESRPADAAAPPETVAEVARAEPPSIERFRKLRERKTETPTVFISYAREDEAQARELHRRLGAAGFKPWLDKEALLGGQEWESVIEEMIEKSDFVLICLSDLSINKRGYVQKELRKTLEVVDLQPEGAVYLIPLRLDNCEIPRSLGRFNCINVFEESGYDRLERSIRDAWRRSRMRRR